MTVSVRSGARQVRSSQSTILPQSVLPVMRALGYVSSQWASEMRLPTETVLHHHAHAAAARPSMAGRWTVEK